MCLFAFLFHTVQNKMWSLRTWDGFLCGLHSAVFIAAISVVVNTANTRNFRVPILTHYAEWDPDTGPIDSTQELGLFPFAYVTCVVPLLSAIAHGIAYYMNKKYNTTNLFNTSRWIEYSFSSTLMFFLICLLFAIYDINTLIALSVMNASVMFCGYMMEQLNIGRSDVRWSPFLIGCFIATIQWSQLYSTLSVTDDQMPFLIWIALGSYFYMFLLFPLNMFCFYMYDAENSVSMFGKCCIFPLPIFYILRGAFRYFQNDSQAKTGYNLITDQNKIKKFEAHEKVYMILSLTSKNLLLWLIIFGVNQPSVYT